MSGGNNLLNINLIELEDMDIGHSSSMPGQGTRNLPILGTDHTTLAVGTNFKGVSGQIEINDVCLDKIEDGETCGTHFNAKAGIVAESGIHPFFSAEISRDFTDRWELEYGAHAQGDITVGMTPDLKEYGFISGGYGDKRLIGEEKINGETAIREWDVEFKGGMHDGDPLVSLQAEMKADLPWAGKESSAYAFNGAAITSLDGTMNAHLETGLGRDFAVWGHSVNGELGVQYNSQEMDIPDVAGGVNQAEGVTAFARVGLNF